jgi:ligand-binding sensor domain-containing protein
VILGLVFCQAQQLPTTQYSTENILPHNTVRKLLYTDDGTLWIGTDNGLVSKHNNTINSYFVEDGLPLNNIWALAIDQDKQLWVGTYGKGIACFDGTDFYTISTKNGLVHDEITHLQVADDLLFVGTSNGISVIKISEKRILKSVSFKTKQLMRVSGFFEFENEMYATTYNTGIFKITIEKEEVLQKKISDHTFIYSAIVAENKLYASNKEYLSVFDLNEATNYYFPEPKTIENQPIVWDYIKTKENKLYGAAWGIYKKNGGLMEFGKDENNYKYIPSCDSKEVLALAYNPIQNVIYAGTLDKGLYQIELKPAVRFFASNHQKVMDLTHFDNHKIILFNDGLSIDSLNFNPSFFKEKQENYVSKNRNKLPKHKDFYYELIYATKAEDIEFYTIKKSDNNVWINTSIGMFSFTPKGDFESYLPIHTLAFDFGPNNELVETNPYHGARIHKSGTLENTYYPEAFPTTPTAIVNTLRMADKLYMLSVFKGLFTYDGNFQSYRVSEIWDEPKLKHATNYKNGIAISNEAGDIFIIDDLEKFNISEIIPRATFKGNTISLLENYNDWLIIATEKGITFYNGKKQIFLDKEQGISKPVYASSIKNDILYLASDGGIYQVNLKKVTEVSPRIHTANLEQFTVNGSALDLLNIKEKLFKFSSGQNQLDISFSTNYHPYPNKLKYYYRLKDNATWEELDAQEISLRYVEPANYKLSVRIDDSSTGESFESELIFFEIALPFYRQWWFVALMTVLFLTSVMLFFEIRKRALYKKNLNEIAVNKRIEELKTEALIAQMNPHFIFNALNSIQYMVVLGENEKAARYLSKFAQLVRANLNNSQKPLVSLKEELEYLKTYCEIENERHANRIEIIFEVDETIDTSQIEIPALILQPFLENAFVHAFPPKIKSPKLLLSIISIDEKTIKYNVRDNGIGTESIDKKTHKASNGIGLIKERLHFLKYNVETCLNIDYTKQGTTITLYL